MLHSGLCASLIKPTLRGVISLQTLYHFTYSGGLWFVNNHQSQTGPPCTAYQGLLKDYQTRRIEEKCDCQSLRTDTSGVVSHWALYGEDSFPFTNHTRRYTS